MTILQEARMVSDIRTVALQRCKNPFYGAACPECENAIFSIVASLVILGWEPAQ